MDNLAQACKKYQTFSRTTILNGYGDIDDFRLGINNEIGEMLGDVKKFKRGDFNEEMLRVKLTDEIGDVCWYISNLFSLWDGNFYLDPQRHAGDCFMLYTFDPQHIVPKQFLQELNYHIGNLWNDEYIPVHGLTTLQKISNLVGKICIFYGLDIEQILIYNQNKLTKRFNLGEIKNHA